LFQSVFVTAMKDAGLNPFLFPAFEQ